MKKKLLSIFLSLAMVVTMMPMATMTAFATDSSSQPAIVMLKANASGSNAVKLSWNKVDNATKYVVYGNQCGKLFKQLATVKSNSYTVKKIKNTKLKAHKPYKFYVVAFSGELQLAKSNKAVCITAKTYKKYANVSKIVATKTAVELNVGETAQLGAKTTLVKKSKKHLPSTYGKTSYKTSNSSVATVSSKGVVTAVAEGTATIYIQDISGKYCTTTVTVKAGKPEPTPTPVPGPTPVTKYTVTFDMQGYGTAVSSQVVTAGSKVTKPTPAPTATGYTFGDWYKDANYTTKWYFNSDTVTSNITLYAKWTAKETAIEEAVVDGTDIKADGKTVNVTSGENKTQQPLTETQATDLANKINDLLKNSAVADFSENGLKDSTNIEETTGLNAIIGALKNEAPDNTAKKNLEGKTSENVDLQIKVVLSAVNVNSTEELTVTSMEFDVTPIATTTVQDSSGKIVSVSADIKSCLTSEVKFRLPIDSSLKDGDNTIAVYHEGEFLSNYEIKGEAPNTYIEIESRYFSKYSYQLLNANNAGAKIVDKLYFKFADAVADVEDGKTITLLKPANGELTISKEISFTVDKNEKNYNATLKPGDGYILNKTDETKSLITYRFFPENKQFTITYKDAGDIAFSGIHGENHPTSHTYGTATTLVAPTKTGYTFEGWFTTSDCTGTAVTALGATAYDADITLYAKWAKTVANVLATVEGGFPTAINQFGEGADAWMAANINKCYRYDSSLCFLPAETFGLNSIGLNKSVVKSGNDYIYSGENSPTITFHMTGDVLTSITFTNESSIFDGTYTAPETKTLSEILPSGFPTSADSAWVTTDSKKAYKDGDNIKVGTLTLGKDTTVTKSGDNYVCTSGDATVTFNVKDGAVDSITVTGSSGSNGTYSESGCIAAGTMISMPGGTQKAVEELEIGDVICTFDHETGEVSSAPVAFIWESENVGNAFTLTFEDDVEVAVIEEHGFYDKEEQKYVFINLQNAEEYIGDHFYNADSNSWLVLKGCEALKRSVDAYAIITSGHLNHMSNGMLSMCDGSVKAFANIFEYDNQMKFDEDKKKADIEKYGLTPKEKILELKGFTEADYDAYNLQYVNVMIGKGLITWEWMEALSDYCVANGL